MKKITLILSSALLIALIALSAVPSSFAADNERPFDWTKISTSLYEGLHEYGATNSITVDGPSGEIYYFGQGYTSSDGTFPTVLKFNTNTGIWTDIIAGSNNPFSNEARAIYSAVKIPNTNNVLVGLTLNNEGAQLWRLDMSNDTWTSDARYTPDDDHDIIPSIAISSTGKECMLAPQNFSTPAVFCAPDADTNFTALNMSGPGTFDLSYANVNLPVITFLGEDPIISTYESGEGTVYPSIWRYFTDDEEWFQITYNDFNPGEQVRGLANAQGVLYALIENRDTHNVRVQKYDPEGDEWIVIGGQNFSDDYTFDGPMTLISASGNLFASALSTSVENASYYWNTNDEVWVRINIPSFTGAGEDDEDTISSVEYFNNGVFTVATARSGEGWYGGKAFLNDLDGPDEETTTTTTTVPNAPDGDLDGVLDSVEHKAPNAGDGNGDGSLDEDQNHVSSFPSKTNGKFVTIVSPEGTQLSLVSDGSESEQSAKDDKFDYKFGLINFTVSGVTPGATITMNIYFEDSDAANTFVARKLKGTQYSTLDGAALRNVTVGTSTPAVKLTYSIADNGALDTNTTAGVITDPVGLGSAAGSLPATGSNSAVLVNLSLLILALGAALAFAVRSKRVSFRFVNK